MSDDVWELRPPLFHTAPTYEHTFGPQVRRVCELAGYVPDPEQQLMLDDLFAVDDDGKSIAFETCVIAPRQQLKTGVGKMAALGWLFVTQEELITWSAHLFTTTEEAFRDIAGLITSSPVLRKRLAPGRSNGIHSARGSEHIELADGRRMLFRSRTKSGGRGLTGDKMILDESLYLEPEHLGALIPTLTAVPDPQILHLSSAGLARSRVLRDIRDRGRSGSPGLAYGEWGTHRQQCLDEKCSHPKPASPAFKPGCAVNNESLWRQASPLMGRQRSNGTGLTIEKMRKFRESEPTDEWIRERLGWWDEAGAGDLFGAGRWEACLGAVPDVRTFGAVGVAVSPDLTAAAVAYGARANDLILPLPVEHASGTGWVVDSAVEAAAAKQVPIVIDGGGPGAYLVDQLTQAARRHGIKVIAANLAQWKDACARFHENVISAKLRHAGWPELDASVASATKRIVGDRWVWGRAADGDISVLEAVTWGVWGMDNVRTTSVVDDRVAAGGSAVLSV